LKKDYYWYVSKSSWTKAISSSQSHSRSGCGQHEVYKWYLKINMTFYGQIIWVRGNEQIKISCVKKMHDILKLLKNSSY